MSNGDSHARSRFQSGLLTWLRAAAPQEHANGLREMIAVTRSLADDEAGSQGDGLLWRSAGSFLQALLDGSLRADDEARALCRRLERQLACRDTRTRHDRADALANAIFAFVSNRSALPASQPPEIACRGDAGLNTMLAGAFSATADLLPLLGNARPRRFSEQQQQSWKKAVADLRRDWHAVLTGQQTDCRAASTALLQVALELADPPGLRLAEAFAEAAGAAENGAVLTLPGFRAAFAAALEVAEHTDGPEQKGFAESASALGSRLLAATALPKAGQGLVCASAPWFAEDARETLTELAVALDAVPPRRLALLAGFDWFVQHESGKVMAIRGLAATAHKIIGQIRSDDLDQTDTHAIIGRAIDALRQAVDALAGGLPPHPNEAAFAELRGLDAIISEQRRQAIAGVKMTNATPPAPTFAEPPLQ